MSEEEAAAAVRALVLKVNEAEQVTVQTGDFTELQRLSTPDRLAEEHRELPVYIRGELMQKGEIVFDRFQTLAVEAVSPTSAKVTAQFCADVSGAYVVDTATGKNLTSPDRANRQSLKVTAEFGEGISNLSPYSSFEEGNACSE